MSLTLKKDVPKGHKLYHAYANAVKHSDAKTAKELLKDMRKYDRVVSPRARRASVKRELMTQLDEMDDPLEFEDSDAEYVEPVYEDECDECDEIEYIGRFSIDDIVFNRTIRIMEDFIAEMKMLKRLDEIAG